MILGVFFSPKDYPAWSTRGILGLAFNPLSKACRFRRNPRELCYLRSLLARAIPMDVELKEAEDLSIKDVKHVEDIILLWPDGNGYGWFGLERKIFSWKKRGAAVTVLNGRGRYFCLSRAVWGGYLVRRFLERFWIGEIAFSLIFLLVSPFLVIWDLARGRD